MHTPLRCSPACLNDLPFIDQLRRRNAAALGFLSHQAISEKIRLGQVLIGVAVDTNKPLGFILHGSLRRPEVRLFQLAVDFDVRGQRVARRLLAALLRRCRQAKSAGLSLRCREDLSANRFWHRAGFDLHHLEAGRRGTLFVWTKPLIRPPMFAFHSRWHFCPSCGQTTCGSWTSRGVRSSRCDGCGKTPA